MPLSEEHKKAARNRVWMFGIILLPFIGLLVARLWWIQVRQGPEYVESILRQSLRDIRVPAIRGRIVARGGEVLADNRPSFDVVLNVEYLHRRGYSDKHTVGLIAGRIHTLAEIINRPPPLTDQQIHRHIDWYPALPLTIFEDLDKRELTLASELIKPADGFEIKTSFKRVHPRPSLAVHVLGFTGHRYPPDETERSSYSYFEREPHGQSGLEMYYDELLSGKAGRKTVRVDTLGYIHDEATRAIAPQDGATIRLALDLRAQQIAQRLIAHRKGAFVLLDVTDGGVLAMASTPGYSLGGLTSKVYGELASDEEKRPLVNRAVLAGYMPGSIIKPLIALAGMNEKVIDPVSTTINCPGYYKLGNLRIHCGRRSGHGDLQLVHAIAQSCNTYFIAAGQKIGLEGIAETFRHAGFGRSPELDIPGGGGGGLVPSRQWARSTLQREWIASDTAFISIGQGAVNVSPLQAAVYCAAIANGGAVLRPHLAKTVIGSDGQILKNFGPEVRDRLPATEEQLAILHEGMTAVVNSDIATAPQARNKVISIAGKTGTAEVGPRSNRRKNTWFIGFAPVEAPQYAFAIVIEDGDSGGRTAAPIASNFFENWLSATPAP